ncbi:MAG: hypothetical protein IPM55_13260 [Acidobacteria bacterium]|nr:hypothetical protein [Acidobacteriota bacterium]
MIEELQMTARRRLEKLLQSMFDFIGPERLTNVCRFGLAMARRIVELHGGRVSSACPASAPATTGTVLFSKYRSAFTSRSGQAFDRIRQTINIPSGECCP